MQQTERPESEIRHVEASSIGFPIGGWPLSFWWQDKQWLLVRVIRDQEGEVTEAIYSLAGHSATLIVWND